MHRARWLAWCVAFIVALALAVAIWAMLRPREPYLPGYQGFETQTPGYSPGGPGCDPQRLARLAIPSREAANERARCSEAAENYRLQANDLIQQTRSADASAAVVSLTYQQSLVAVASLILGFTTMLAATAAAIYARQAASETRRTANAAIDSIGVALRAAKATERANEIAASAGDAARIEAIEANRIASNFHITQQRPWVSFRSRLNSGITWSDEKGMLSIRFLITNTGNSPARNVRIFPRIVLLFGNLDIVEAQRLHADEIRNLKRNDGITIFPGQEFSLIYQLTITTQMIEQYKKWHFACYKTDNDWISPHIHGCIDYYSLFTESSHQTGFIFSILRTVPINGCVAIAPSLGDIPNDNLELTHWVQDGRTD